MGVGSGELESEFIGLAVEDGDYGIGRDADQGGLGLEADAHAEKRGELARWSGDGDDGATIGHAEDFAVLAVEPDQVAGAETVECVHGGKKWESTPHPIPPPQPLSNPMGEGGVGLSLVEGER